jgi:hypothetical protein
VARKALALISFAAGRKFLSEMRALLAAIPVVLDGKTPGRPQVGRCPAGGFRGKDANARRPGTTFAREL